MFFVLAATVTVLPFMLTGSLMGLGMFLIILFNPLLWMVAPVVGLLVIFFLSAWFFVFYFRRKYKAAQREALNPNT